MQSPATVSHLPSIDQQAIEDFIAKLNQNLGDRLVQTLLFGSKARGDFDDESDIDILAVVSEEDNLSKLKWEIVGWASEVSLRYNVLIVPIVMSFCISQESVALSPHWIIEQPLVSSQ